MTLTKNSIRSWEKLQILLEICELKKGKPKKELMTCRNITIPQPKTANK